MLDPPAKSEPVRVAAAGGNHRARLTVAQAVEAGTSPTGHRRTDSTASTGTEGSTTAVEDTLETYSPTSAAGLRARKRAAEEDEDEEDAVSQVPGAKRLRVLTGPAAGSTMAPVATSIAGLARVAAPHTDSISTAAAPAVADATVNEDAEPDEVHDVSIAPSGSQIAVRQNSAENSQAPAAHALIGPVLTECSDADMGVSRETDASGADPSNTMASLQARAPPSFAIDTGTPDSDPEYEAVTQRQMEQIATRVREYCTGRRPTTTHGHGVAPLPPDEEDYKNLPPGEGGAEDDEDESDDDEGDGYDGDDE